MKNWKRVVLGALAGLGVTLAAHAYGPGNPASLPSVPPGFKECGVDGAVCKVPAGATVYVVYGTNGKFATAQGTGDFTCLPAGWVKAPTADKPQDLGIPDPVPNVQKKCYVQAAAPQAAGFSGKGPAGCTDKRCWLEAVGKAQNACKASGCSTCTPNTTASDNCKFENGYTCTSFCKAATPPAAATPVAAPPVAAKPAAAPPAPAAPHAAHGYGPGNPASLPSVPPGFKECGVDGAVCKVPAGVTTYVVYGTNGKFATAQGTGDFTCLPAGWVKAPSAAKPQDLGIPDPVPNVQKKCYVQVAGAGTPPAPQAPPAPKPGDVCAPQIPNNAGAAAVCTPVCDKAGLKFGGNWSNDRNHPPVASCIRENKGQSVCGCAAK